MGMSNFCQTIAISILMVHAQGLNFSFPEFTRCNATNILCVLDATISGHEIHLTNSTSSHYKLANKTAGRVFHNQTIRLSSLASFTTRMQFVMEYNNLSPDNYIGGHGIAFFMTSKEIAAQQTWHKHAGLPGNGSEFSPDTFAVEFSSITSKVHTKVGNARPIDYNETILNETLNDGTLWSTRIDYNDIKKFLQIFLFNASKSASMSQTDPVLAHSFDCSKYLPDDLVVGISASAHNSLETHKILSWSFNTKTKPRKSHSKTIILATVVTFVCFIAVVVVCSLFSIVRKKRRLTSSSEQTCEDNEIELEMFVNQGPCRYTLEDLKAGTNNFSDSVKLGQGGSGDVYKAILKEANEVVAVKRISERSRQGMKEFISEVSIVSRVRHRNLVQLLGWCHEKGELLLVYEYMSNGSLDKYLFRRGDSPLLQWTHRFRIALEIAYGLMYLHEGWDQCIVHRDVKSSNVMLDCNFNAKLGDFGLARMFEHNRLSQTTIAAGTMGYLAPECVMTGRTSRESDVYSFGALALEIATGKKALDVSFQEHNMRLVEWVWDLYGQGKVLEAADWRLDGDFDMAEMEQLMGIGLWCSHPDPAERPKITQVVKLLKMDNQVPHLPPALPVPTYAAVQGAKLSVVSSFTTGTSQAFPYFVSSSSHSTASSTSIAADAPGTVSQVSSSSYSNALPME